MFFLGLLASAWACTVQYESRVVGAHPTDDLVVVRVQVDELVQPVLHLVLFDAATGTEQKRYPILKLEDEGDSAVRARRWKAAEADLTTMGIVFDPHGKPLPMQTTGGIPHPLEVEGGTFTFSMGYDGEGMEEDRTLEVTWKRGSEPAATRELARWARMTDANAYHYVRGIWALPESRVAVIEASGCREPSVHFFDLSPS